MEENVYYLVKSTYSQQTKADLLRAYNITDPDKVEIWIKCSPQVRKWSEGKEGQTFTISAKDQEGDKFTVTKIQFVGGGSTKVEQHEGIKDTTALSGDRNARIERQCLLKVAAELYGKGEFASSSFSELLDMVEDIFEKRPITEKVR